MEICELRGIFLWLALGCGSGFSLICFCFVSVFLGFTGMLNGSGAVSLCGGGCVMMHSGAGHLNVSRVFLLWYATERVFLLGENPVFTPLGGVRVLVFL